MKTEEKKDKIPYSQICKPFEEARAFAQSLGLKDLNEWVDYCRSGSKPNDIPQKPDRIYKNKGWKNYGDWLGVWKAAPKAAKSVESNEKQYMPFEEAKQFVQSLKIRNVKEWFKYCDSGKRPKDIPYNPDRAYKNDGWKSYADWLGTAKIPSDFKYRKFEDARRFVRGLKFEGLREWNAYCTSGSKPDDIPFAPYVTYAEEGWISMEDWLGVKEYKGKDKKGKSSSFDSSVPFAKFRK